MGEGGMTSQSAAGASEQDVRIVISLSRRRPPPSQQLLLLLLLYTDARRVLSLKKQSSPFFAQHVRSFASRPSLSHSASLLASWHRIAVQT